MKQGDVRIAWPKMFAQKDSPYCPIRVYKEYRARRPADTNIDNARFYLRPISSPSSRTWFSHQPIGKEKLGKILSDISKKGGLMVRKKNLCPREIFHAFLASVDFFRKILSRILSEFQTDWIQIRPDVLQGLIWVQSVCKGYEQTALEDNDRVNYSTGTLVQTGLLSTELAHFD